MLIMNSLDVCIFNNCQENISFLKALFELVIYTSGWKWELLYNVRDTLEVLSLYKFILVSLSNLSWGQTSTCTKLNEDKVPSSRIQQQMAADRVQTLISDPLITSPRCQPLGHISLLDTSWENSFTLFIVMFSFTIFYTL